MRSTIWPAKARNLVAAISIRKLLVLLSVAALASLAICHYWTPIPYYEKLIRIQADQELGRIDERILNEPLAVQALLLDYSRDKDLTLKAWIALSKYPEKSRNIFQLYGSEQEFKDILRSYGDPVIPVIQYFLDHEVKSLVVMKATQTVVTKVVDWAKEKWDQIRGNPPPPPAPVSQQPQSHELDSTERGWYAVNFIKEEGHSFLGEFVVDKNKDAKWIQTQRITNALTSFFTSGVRNLETKQVLDEKITVKDGFFAAIDVIPFAVSLKLLRAGKAVATSGKVVSASGKELSLVSRTRIFASRLIPKGAFFQKLGKYGAAMATAYVVLTNPGLVNSLFAELADLLGLDPLLIQFFGWLIILTIILYPFSWALKGAARTILWGFARLESRKRKVKVTRRPTPVAPRTYTYRPVRHNVSNCPA
jgi:hypothetical protein